MRFSLTASTVVPQTRLHLKKPSNSAARSSLLINIGDDGSASLFILIKARSIGNSSDHWTPQFRLTMARHSTGLQQLRRKTIHSRRRQL
jgi:hypothetical protein